MNGDLRWMVAGSGAAHARARRRHRPRRARRRAPPAPALRDDRAPDRRRRPRSPRARRGAATRSAWLAREFNTMADSMTGLRRRGPRPARAARDDHQQHRRRHRRARREAAGDRGQRRVPAARAPVAARRCSAAGAERRATGCAASTGCPTLACLQSGERQVRICERRLPGRRRRVGGGAHLADPRRAAAASTTSSRCGATSPSGARRRRGWPSRTALASLGLLASGFSHELNTPLATILMCVEGILRERRAAARRRTWRSIGESAGDRARAGAAVPRHHAALPPHGARAVLVGRDRRCRGRRVGGRAAGGADGARERRSGSSSGRCRPACTCARTRPTCSTRSSTCCSTRSRRARRGRP